MAMDLTQSCDHCGARVGEICAIDCPVNGGKIALLVKALNALGLTLRDVRPTKRKGTF